MPFSALFKYDLKLEYAAVVPFFMDFIFSTSNNFWFWVVVLEKLILFFFWKFSPKQVMYVYKVLQTKYKRFFKLSSHGRPTRDDYWDIYYQIKDILRDNLDWGASKIHGEILKLGFDPSLSLVKRIITRILKRSNPSGNWKSWWKLFDHLKSEVVAMDLCRIQTIYGTTLYALAFIERSSRKIIHLNITEHPTRAWVLRQIEETKSLCLRFQTLLSDNDVLFSGQIILNGLQELGIQSLHTPPASPWCNGIMERWFGSLRRECLNHIPIFSLHHAHRVAQEYVDYYNHWRPHLALNKDSPCGRVVTFPTPTSKVIKRKVLGGLHHVYLNSEVA
ncbi:integrase core domain protein [Leptospira borgpetersenii serovar Hardjo-bovis str. Sponselee]|uniref:Integrase core domain protein n=3 Tax=Leptospira borgpetersenii TaxID=174 RepID=M6C6E6_LEPBO|nr:integrase core domain-containing protein [Leptospira borgpetersenii]AMX59042.1 integrase [Leptospira borgpetersenii serovar Hardjo]EMJ77522.1 integrase core domain protein [Leptospira borgpetersenii serovar Hardjo-bovis str. Sponselee]EMJ83429.1 integrase core domain protein [Leptospira borgpetersenii serovar Hardjo-bovis str. Sponselee]EMJ84348.1 integrase core domain protein [Leptospira borgpetersenii serovar Hardjo-bovis str. Sponselee]MBE8375316.1 transposase [Leptospira borgpetersenii 